MAHQDVIFLAINEFITYSLHVFYISFNNLIEDKSILPNSVALMSPKFDNTKSIGLISGSLSKYDVLNDS